MRRLNLFGRAAALLLAVAIPATGLADAVTDWNLIMQQAVAAAPTNSVVQTRWGAIVQVAVFEAVNAIEGDYEPYLGVIEAAPGASPEAAAVAAAHRALVTLRPELAATLDTSRAASLAAIADGPSKEAGIAVGEAAAAAILALRADDGSAAAATAPYTPGTEPGDWRPELPSFAAAFLPGWGDVTPFGLESGSQFRLPPPPALHTGRYARDFNEVKLLGRIDSPFRPQDRTNVARFYAANSPVLTWNPVARQASLAQGKSLSENARIFALLGMAMADGAIASFDNKYHYSLWRPQTAIRNGDIDGNPLTAADSEWIPLIATPAFPSYASAHATVSNAARAVLEQAFGKDGHDVTLSNPTVAGVTLHYTAWKEMTDDIDDARVYGGIHFSFDQEAGTIQGSRVGRYILSNYLRPWDEIDDEA